MKSTKIFLLSAALGASLILSACSDSITKEVKSNTTSKETQGISQSASSGNNSKSQSSGTGSSQTTSLTYKDGTYEGTARGYHPNLTVSVTVSNNKITSIEVTSHNETPGFYEKAFDKVPQEIIDAESTSADTVSGATRSSMGIINAVSNALKNAEV